MPFPVYTRTILLFLASMASISPSAQWNTPSMESWSYHSLSGHVFRLQSLSPNQRAFFSEPILKRLHVALLPLRTGIAHLPTQLHTDEVQDKSVQALVDHLTWYSGALARVAIDWRNEIRAGTAEDLQVIDWGVDFLEYGSPRPPEFKHGLCWFVVEIARAIETLHVHPAAHSEAIEKLESFLSQLRTAFPEYFTSNPYGFLPFETLGSVWEAPLEEPIQSRSDSLTAAQIIQLPDKFYFRKLSQEPHSFDSDSERDLVTMIINDHLYFLSFGSSGEQERALKRALVDHLFLLNGLVHSPRRELPHEHAIALKAMYEVLNEDHPDVVGNTRAVLEAMIFRSVRESFERFGVNTPWINTLNPGEPTYLDLKFQAFIEGRKN